MGENTLTGTDDTFAELIASPLPTLVDFWAEWCGPCKMMDRPLEEIAAEQAGKIQIVKLNVDENPSTAMEHAVLSIPTLMIFQAGEVKKRLVGARSKAQLESEIAPFLS